MNPSQRRRHFRLVLEHVRFTPGARTHWHSHANGQPLMRTNAIGLVGTRGDVTQVVARALGRI
jgi:hypothetical protein